MNRLTVTLHRTERILGWIFLAVQLLFLQPILVLLNALLGYPLSDVHLNFIFFAFNFLCITLIFHRFLIDSARLSLRAPFVCLRAAFLAIVAYWILSYLVGTVIIMLYPDFYNVNDSSISGLTADNYPLMAIGTVLLVPITEEVLYRGLVFGLLYNRSRIAAYIVSTAVFSALHIVGYIGYYEPLHLTLCFVQYLPAGFCLAWAYARADSIWAPIVMHVTINQIGILSMR